MADLRNGAVAGESSATIKRLIDPHEERECAISRRAESDQRRTRGAQLFATPTKAH